MMRAPKVLVFTPTYSGKEYCRKAFLESVSKISYPNWDFLLVDNSASPNYARKLRRQGVSVTRVPRGANSREALAAAQNYARNKVLGEGYDYLLSLESDIFPPPDIIWRLLKHSKQVVGALYFIGGMGDTPRVPCVFITDYKEDKGMWGTRLINAREHSLMERDGGIHQVHGMGVGCTLISKGVLSKYAFWTDNRFTNKHSDVYFYMKLWNNKVPVYVDYDTVCHHENSDWGLVKDR